MCRLSNRSGLGDRAMIRLNVGITIEAMIDRIERIKHRDMNDGHCPAGSAGPQLLAKNTGIARRDRSVIQTARIDRNLVPTMKSIGSS